MPLADRGSFAEHRNRGIIEAELVKDFVRMLSESRGMAIDGRGGSTEAPGRRQVARRSESFVFEDLNGFAELNVGIGEEPLDVIDGAEGGTFFAGASNELHARPFLYVLPKQRD